MKHWEMKVAHGIITTADPSHSNQALIDGRLFFASKQAYPMGVFSIVKYEPKKEEAMRRRRKLEEMGGGGRMYFATEGRDWRGTSYRSIIFSLVSEEKVKTQKKREKQREERRRKKRQKMSKKAKRKKAHIPPSSDSSVSTDSSSDSSLDEYTPGFVDDPEMVHGRHRQTIMGDKLVGPIISSTIQFVRPRALKSELNKQFRERFDGWEPPRTKWR